MVELVSGLADGLTAYGAFSKPYLLFGHSLGAWIAYELLAELMRRHETPPLLLIVSGMRAPHLSAAEHDADRVAPTIAHLDTPDFWSHFERRYGRNPDLSDPLAREFVLPLLRADFELLEAVRRCDRSPRHPSCAHLLCPVSLSRARSMFQLAEPTSRCLAL